MALATPHIIHIDAGGVTVELVDTPMERPFELRYQAQGTCQPEVAITTANNVTRATHTKSCHGTGKHQGTLFTLTMSSANSFELFLNAGGIELVGPGLDHYRQLNLAAKVGGIANTRPGLDLDLRRKWLVGAAASAERASGCCTMLVNVNYGGIAIR